MFLAASVIIWLAQITKVFDLLVRALVLPVKLAGLPPETAKIFLFGFFRRDYGAAGLYDMDKHQMLNNVQVVVACVALTLFLPCIAQFLVNIRERGFKTGMAISAVTLVVSFTVACMLNMILVGFGVKL
jgi:ferrous iron transport protein B